MKFSAQSCIFKGGGCETMQECWKLFDELDICNEVNNTWLHSFAHWVILLGLIQFSWQQWQFDQTLKREAVLILFLSIKNNIKIHPNRIRLEEQQWKTNLWLQPIIIHLIVNISFYVTIAINLQKSSSCCIIFLCNASKSHKRVLLQANRALSKCWKGCFFTIFGSLFSEWLLKANHSWCLIQNMIEKVEFAEKELCLKTEHA